MYRLLGFAFVLFAQATELPRSFQYNSGHYDRSEGLDCKIDPCRAVLPGAVRFETIPDKPYVRGLDANDASVGWVALSTDVVDIMGYSGKPLFTLVGLKPDGVIAGARVVHHSEPILLVGIPEHKFIAFVDEYTGIKADERVIVGGTSAEFKTVDIVSGATVTVQTESQTILETARRVGEDVGVIENTRTVAGHFVVDKPWSWSQLVQNKALGHLIVSQDQMESPLDPEGRPFVDIWFGIADAPQVGVPLLGANNYKWAMNELKEGEHLFVVFNSGSYSFKGSGFVRGGIFDRFHIEQGLKTLSFTDMDYQKLDSPDIEDAPHLWEGGLFITQSGAFDPALTYELSILGSKFALERGAFERDFQTFESTHRVPSTVYALEGPDPELEAKNRIWKAAWAQGWPRALFTGLYMLFVMGLFVGRKWMAGKMARLKVLHTSVTAVSFFVLGLWLHIQPSVTQLLTIGGNLNGDWNWRLFLSDPVLFVSWTMISIMIVLWGRGVFCGWVCPYGALNEIAFKIGRALKLPEYELPDRIHLKARYIRYVVFFGLLAVFLYDAELGERMAEIEPFKSTFFVPLWTRHWTLILWWTVLFGVSFTTYRPFCRYVCPLGAAIAIPSSFRLSGPHRKEFCSKCKICARGCEPRAIRPDGTIDPRECLNCWECEAKWQDNTVCPPLVKIRRDAEKKQAVS